MSGLGLLQDELQGIHAVQAELRVDRFLVDRDALTRLGVTANADEEVLVLEEGGEVHLAVYLAPRVLEAVTNTDGLLHLYERGLQDFCLAAEGVSHFLYLVNRAAVPRGVSLLELEVQAEIDKFAIAALELRRAGRVHELKGLLRRLFEDVSYLPHLGAESLERYRVANRLAHTFCRALLKLISAGHISRALDALRRVYRLGAGEKLGLLAAA